MSYHQPGFICCKCAKIKSNKSCIMSCLPCEILCIRIRIWSLILPYVVMNDRHLRQRSNSRRRYLFLIANLSCKKLAKVSMCLRYKILWFGIILYLIFYLFNSLSVSLLIWYIKLLTVILFVWRNIFYAFLVTDTIVLYNRIPYDI